MPSPSAEHTSPDHHFLELIRENRVKAKLEMVRKVLKNQDTPFLILEVEEARKALAYFHKYLPFINIFYAMKANSHDAIMGEIKRAGFGVDAASVREVEAALRTGFDPANILLANPYKNDDALHTLFKNNLMGYTYDCESELAKIAAFRDVHGYKANPVSLLRIKPRISPYFQSLQLRELQIDLSKKFGASTHDSVNLIRTAMKLGLNPGGIAFHIGSNCLIVEHYIESFRAAVEVIRRANKDLGLNMRTIDIGGGFPNNAHNAQGIDGLDGFFSLLADSLREEGADEFQIFAEPGRVVSGATSTLVTKILGIKDDGSQKWLILDDGVYGYYSSVFTEQARFCYLPVGETYYDANTEMVPYTLGGPTCDSFDIIAKNVMLPRDLKVGDHICSIDVGAYSCGTATQFNGFVPGPIVVIDPEKKLSETETRASA